MDHTVHLVDLFRWIFDVEISEVYAEVNSLLVVPDVVEKIICTETRASDWASTNYIIF
jgi:hypothetical protein